MAVRRRFLVRALLCRSLSRWSRKARDRLDIESGPVELGGRGAGPVLDEHEEQLEGVAIGGDGAGAGIALFGETVGEEALERGGDRVIARSPLGRARGDRRRGRAAPALPTGTSTSSVGRGGRGRSTATGGELRRSRPSDTTRAACSRRKSAAYAEFRISAIRWTAGLCALSASCCWWGPCRP